MDKIPSEKFQIIGADEAKADAIARPRVSYLQDVWRRFRQNKMALIALIILTILIVMVLIGPAISGYEFEEVDKTARNMGPSASHWFGTDKLGRDLFARVWQGGRVSILIGLVGALVSAVIGCLYGGIAAYFGGIVDDVMMRILEVIISIPYLIVVILLSVVLESKSVGTLILAMTIAGWCQTARLVRGQMLSLKSQEYVLAAQALGVSPWRIILKHMLPNTLSVILVSVTFDIPNYIFSEAFLSYVGLGIQPPNTSWGALCSMAQTTFTFYPYQLFFPALMIALTMLSFTLLGDGLRDALDPRLRK
ncbi:MAG TPA: ABC transporter permease [Firmicutes bacterium]|nr:ABC transporter permease [Bacillota bacterium]